MALIKCKECGHMISDKATKCPKCGCPKGNVETVQEQMYEDEKPKKKWWIWALVIALLCLIGGGVFYYLSEKGKSVSEASTDEKKDSVDIKNAIVEITPDLIKALETYEELKPFNEGYAAVCRGEKWGFINTEGEEVIPCSFDHVDIFNDGFAAVCKDEKWGFIDTKGNVVIPMKYDSSPTPFSEGLAGFKDPDKEKWGWIDKKGNEIIPATIDAIFVGQFSEGMAFGLKDDYKTFFFLDKTGKIAFTGKTDGNLYYVPLFECFCEDAPKFHNGLVYVGIPTEDDQPQKYTQYDKTGKKQKTISQRPDGYEIFAIDTLGNDADAMMKYINADESASMGIKDNKGAIVIPAQYDRAYTHFSNGVFLVTLFEYKYDTNVDEFLPTIYHYGYADLNGNDTFSEELKERCRKSKEEYIQHFQNENEEMQEYSEEDNSDWLQGRWTADHNGHLIEVIIEGDRLTFKVDGNISYNGTYEYNGDMLIYNNTNDFCPVDNAQQTLTYDGRPMRKGGSCSSSSDSNSGNNSYRFTTAHDVIGYLSDKTFYNGDRRLRIRPEGVWLNDYCATGAPHVEQYESWKATVRAFTATGERLSFLIDPVHGRIIDEGGDIFSLR